ncbi:DUF1203 domain-containing protein [Tateyamaria sp. ANG-S1]|uniref:DUF1203 domain-containing protein n=1 Tax=Tateyamaria sp. ANG-S1 TaxID=1577905 RepID=UPI00057C730F|nr:DUF1203 domain-containing protein [Tateyamaria sp. ANG-S1]KIC49591.1 hypothetical protein RA29_07905 [Tateyamaria sp. ANG-S1]
MPRFSALPTDIVDAYRAGAPDAHGNPPERHISNGSGNPCRHCLQNVPEGAEMLVLAHKPFDGAHPYAEVGPIFLCADPCARGGDVDLPPILTTSPDYLLKGYGVDDRIVYGTGSVTPRTEITNRIAAIFADPQVAYVHVRSARNNCYLARADRAP